MATATTSYPDGTYPESPASKYHTMNATSSRSKRKRDGADSPESQRSAPHARRSGSQQFAAANAPPDDPNNAFSNDIDLSTIHAHNQQQAQASAPSGNVDTAAAALSYSMQVPNHTESFVPQLEHSEFQSINQQTGDPGSGAPPTPHDAHLQPDSSNLLDSVPGDPNSPLTDTPHGAGGALSIGSPMSGKPAVGSSEWHKVRKDNHKEVERRRRETINEGINELAKIVPGCEKNKGSILQRAVQYIQKLQDDAQANIDKWTFEKLVTEQAIGDLSGKLERMGREKETWKRLAREAGMDVESVRIEEDGSQHPGDAQEGSK